MIQTINKETALKDFIEKHVQERWIKNIEIINKNYIENSDKIESQFIKTFEKLCKKAISLQNEGNKGEISYIYISFLRTRIMENTAFYRIDAYDSNWFADKEECFEFWDADFMFKDFFQHMEELELYKSDYLRKITSMDIERIKKYEAIKYHIFAIEFVRTMIDQLIEVEKYKEMLKTPNIVILAGEYMDQTEVLYPKK